MALKMESDPATRPRSGAEIHQLRPAADDRRQQAGPTKPSWEPALKLVESAAKKIALYERCFEILEEEAKRTAALVQDEKQNMMQRIGELIVLLQQSEANHQKTLALLANSTQVCALQRSQLKALTQTLAETRGEVFETTSYIKKLGLLVSRAKQNGDDDLVRVFVERVQDL